MFSEQTHYLFIRPGPFLLFCNIENVFVDFSGNIETLNYGDRIV